MWPGVQRVLELLNGRGRLPQSLPAPLAFAARAGTVPYPWPWSVGVQLSGESAWTGLEMDEASWGEY